MWSNETVWQMCVATDWWQNRLEETCRIMTQREHIGGLYLDVMQDCGLPCYWTPHGHSASGGDAITTGMHELVERCAIAAKAIDPETIITGENITENVIDVVDGTLQVTLWPENRAHIFATVYQDFTERCGTELSTGVGWNDGFKDSLDDNAFFVECASLLVQGAQIGRIRMRPRDAALSLSNPKQQHMVDFLNQVLGYYRNETAKDFHAYGQFMRPLEFDAPSPMPKIRYRDSEYRALWNGIFRNPQGELGIFIANAGKQALAFKSTMNLARHGMTADSVVDVDRISPTAETERIHRNVKDSVTLTGTISGRTIIMYHIKPAEDQ